MIISTKMQNIVFNLGIKIFVRETDKIKTISLVSSEVSQPEYIVQ